MSTLETIGKRFTARNYVGAPTREEMEQIALAGLQSPSAHNKQPWQIIAVTNAEKIAELEAAGIEYMESDPNMAESVERIKARGGKLFYNAQALFLIAIDKDGKGLASSERDCGIVVENMALAATSLGLGNCICGLAGLGFEGERGDYLADAFGFIGGYKFGIGLLVGKTDANNDPHAPNFDKLTWVS